MIDPLDHFREEKSVVEAKIGYRFKNPALLEQAFTHKSYLHERKDILIKHNERLEFLGDTILQFIVSDYLYRRFADEREGALTQFRSNLVMASALVGYIEKIGVADRLILGKAERKLQKKEALFADLFEAILGAIYLDGGLEAARAFFDTHFEKDLLERMAACPVSSKSRLQEWAQKMYQSVPVYEVIEERGPDHDKVFSVQVKVEDQVLGYGEGSSKKQAEDQAAKSALEKIG